jgi:glycosyltransferase involved in cell wall biosynthesis
MRLDLTVVIITYNEEVNLPQALSSISNWAKKEIVVDSYSTDGTIKIANEYGCNVVQHSFKNFAEQRNYALKLGIDTEWVLFLDSDEWLPQATKDEICSVIESNPNENGFYVKHRMIWMGKWIRRGYYPTWILRLFRYGKAWCEERGVNEHLLVDGSVGFLKSDFIHENRKGLSEWIEKHNGYARLEAEELLKRAEGQSQHEIEAKWSGTPAERTRWLRHHIWEHMPPLVRPFFYFTFRYFLHGGFLDGREAFIYHFFQALWYPLLIDAKYLELKRKEKPISQETED